MTITHTTQIPPDMNNLQKNIQKLTEINKQVLNIGDTTKKQSEHRSEKINELMDFMREIASKEYQDKIEKTHNILDKIEKSLININNLKDIKTN